MRPEVLQLLSLAAARVDGRGLDWSMLARAAKQGDLPMLLDGIIPSYESSRLRTKMSSILQAALLDLAEATARVEHELDAAETVGARLVTVLDDDYPANLLEVHDLPPFIFIRGELLPEDLRAVAVVGTRNVSDDGLRRAGRMARELTGMGVTVASGLARGVDTAAHTAALETGGRTIAVVGTGITKCYPSENASLAERIARQGVVVSQFWPTRSPGRDTFPRRNRVTSGISQGTVVIEASSTSGAKMQARLAHEHGKRVWLIRSLVMDQEWAQRMVEEGKAKVVNDTAEVVADLRDLQPSEPLVPEVQMHLNFS